jgi:hypothetical protein
VWVDVISVGVNWAAAKRFGSYLCASALPAPQSLLHLKQDLQAFRVAAQTVHFAATRLASMQLDEGVDLRRKEMLPEGTMGAGARRHGVTCFAADLYGHSGRPTV